MHHYYSTFSIKAIGLCIALFLHDHAYAHQADTLKRQVLDEVVIRTGRHVELLSPSPVQILKEDDLQRLNSLSVADALRYFSGVQLKDYGGVGGLKTVNVRSLGTQHTAVFYDGLQLGNAQNGQVDLGKFSLENLEEVALYSGQRNDLLQSAGSFASASALFLKSKRPVFSNDKRLNTDFNLKAGSFGLVNPSLLLQYKVNNQVSAHLNAAFSNAHGKYKFRLSNGVVDTSAIRSNADIQTIRIETGMHGSTKRGEWQVKFFAFDAERGLPGAIVDNRLDYNQRLWEKNIFLQSSFTHHVNKKYSILLNGKYALDDLRYLDPEITTTKGFLENKYQEKEAFFSVANRYRMTPFWDLALALDYKHNTMDANLDNFPYPNRNSVLTVLATHLKFNRLDIQLNALNTWVKDEVRSGIRPADVSKVTPAVMLSWQPIRYADFRVRSFYKSIFRLPTFTDLYFNQVGYRLLKPEYTEQYNLGITYYKNLNRVKPFAIELQADAYYNRVKDKIIAQPGNNIGVWTMRNLGLVDIRGLEINAKSFWEPNSRFKLSNSIAYTYQKAVDITDRGSNYYKNQIPYIPLHSGTYRLSVDYQNNTGLNYSFIYTGERYNQAASIPVNYVEPWYTHDISAFYKIKFNKQRELKITAELNNLLNQYYDVVANFPMPGRNYRITLNYKI